MIVSILTRKTRIADRGRWEAQLAPALPKIRQVLAGEHGFVSLRYMWSVEDDGEMAQATTWKTLDDCRRYIRSGGAAAVATIEDGALPTAAHPDGAWVRKTYEVSDSEQL